MGEMTEFIVMRPPRVRLGSALQQYAWTFPLFRHNCHLLETDNGTKAAKAQRWYAAWSFSGRLS